MLVLCFNLTLAHRLRRLVGERCAEYGANPALVTCTSFHTLCSRIVEDAAAAGIVAAEPARGTWPEKIVAKTEEVLRSGFECRFDAVLVDEGQDFRVQWWNLLRELVLRDGGEMLLTTDPTVDLYGKASWSSPNTLESAGFTEPWIEMTGRTAWHRNCSVDERFARVLHRRRRRRCRRWPTIRKLSSGRSRHRCSRGTTSSGSPISARRSSDVSRPTPA